MLPLPPSLHLFNYDRDILMIGRNMHMTCRQTTHKGVLYEWTDRAVRCVLILHHASRACRHSLCCPVAEAPCCRPAIAIYSSLFQAMWIAAGRNGKLHAFWPNLQVSETDALHPPRCGAGEPRHATCLSRVLQASRLAQVVQTCLQTITSEDKAWQVQVKE